jgi:hypothetical protein
VAPSPPSVRPCLHRVQDLLMLPARDLPVLARRASGFHWTSGTCGGQRQPASDGAEAPDGPLTRRAAVLIIFRDVLKVLLVEESLGSVA